MCPDLLMFMRKFYSGVTLFLVFTLSQCSSPLDPYPMDKKYWDAKDYDQTLTYIKFRLPEGEQKPNLEDAITMPVFKKLIDRENLTVVLEDESLGVKHRAEFASGMRDELEKLRDVYSVMDREDKYVYDQELAHILNLCMYLESIYFNLGNDDIRKEVDKSNETRLNTIIKSNEDVCVRNYEIYIDFVNRESSFSTEATDILSDGYSQYVTKLINTFPNADYRSFKTKTESMVSKATSPKLKTVLTAINAQLESKVPAPTETVPSE